MQIYNKLVRDRIPAMIEEKGEKANIRILPEDEYVACLEQKLDEEVEEYHRDKNAEELADILEVVFALGNTLGVSQEEILKICAQKRQARGGFSERIFLISKE